MNWIRVSNRALGVLVTTLFVSVGVVGCLAERPLTSDEIRSMLESEPVTEAHVFERLYFQMVPFGHVADYVGELTSGVPESQRWVQLYLHASGTRVTYVNGFTDCVTVSRVIDVGGSRSAFEYYWTGPLEHYCVLVDDRAVVVGWAAMH